MTISARAVQETAAATNRHYGLPPELFTSFLGRHHKYSCALFPTSTEMLDQAQTAKLRMVARMLGLQGGEAVLDVGAGWGSVTIFLARELGCRLTAITPSPTQAEHVRRRALDEGITDLVTVVEGAFPAADLAGRYDAVVMEEVIEHLPDQAAALRRAYSLLVQGGVLYLSASCYRDRAGREEYEHRPASEHAVDLFGHTAMVPLSDLVADAESAGFSLCSLTDLTSHYPPTMEHWNAAIAAGREAMEDLAPGMADELTRYFTAAQSSWGYTAKVYALSAIRSRMGLTHV